MKKLGNGKGRRVHPAPPPRDHLAALPAAVLALVAALTAEEQEVLVYLLSDGGGRWREQRRRRPHAPELGCGCFGCYKSFWARWDASPNRHVIHRIIDAVEEGLQTRECDRGGGGGRRRRQSGRGGRKGADLAVEVAAEAMEEEKEELLRVEGKGFPTLDGGHLADNDGDDDDDGSVDDDDEEDGNDEEEEDDDDDCDDEMNGSCNDNGNKSSVRKLMSFIGERVWGVWT